MSGARRRRDRLRAAALLAALWLPLAALALPLAPAAETGEQRALAAAPDGARDLQALLAFPRAFEAWWGDHFGLRPWLLRLHSRVTVALFPDSQRLRRVVVGQEGWLFYGRDRAFRPVPLRGAERSRARDVLGRRAAWLEERGVRYVVVVVPDKSTVYADRLPAWARPDPVVPLDQLARAVSGIENLDLVDLRPCLREARARERVYEVAGTHWNDRGAFAAARAILAAIGTRLPVQPLAERDVERFEAAEERGRELAGMLGLQDLYPRETLQARVMRPPPLVRTTDVLPSLPQRDPARQPFALAQERPDLPRAVVFRDSFCTRLAPFLGTGFRRSAYYWQRAIDASAVDAERPDVVLDIVVERNLRRLFEVSPIWEGGPAAPEEQEAE